MWRNRRISLKSNQFKFPELAVSRDTLCGLDWRRFEMLIADLWEERGYITRERAETDNDPRDNGIDILARRRGPGGKRVAIQAKCYNRSNNIGAPAVQQYFAMREQVDADESIIVTSGGFTNNAYNVAEKLDVHLINGDKLVSLIDRHASIRFYSEYRDELGLEASQIRRIAHYYTSPSNRIMSAGRSALGECERRLGGVLGTVGDALQHSTVLMWRLSTAVRLRDWMIVAEEKAGETTTGERDAGQAFQEWRRKLVRRGYNRQQPTLINWCPDTKETLPDTGIDPTLYPAPICKLRYQLSLPIVGLVLCLVAMGAVVGPENASPPLMGIVLVGIIFASFGIFLVTTFFSHFSVDLMRYLYLFSVLTPVAAWLFGSWPHTESGFIIITMVGITGIIVFSIHTWFTTCRRRKPFELPETDVSFVPFYRKKVTLSCLGLLLAVGGLLEERTGVATGSLLEITSNASVPIEGGTITVIGLIVLLCTGIFYLWDGGLIGLLSGIFVILCILSISTSFRFGLINSSLSLSAILLIIGGYLLTGIGILSLLRHRNIKLRTIMGGIVLFLLIQEVIFSDSLSDVIVASHISLTTDQLVVGTIGSATGIVLLILFLEQRAISKTI